MEHWIERHFSDNVRAQTTIVIFASAIGAVGVVLFVIAVFLLKHGG